MTVNERVDAVTRRLLPQLTVKSYCGVDHARELLAAGRAVACFLEDGPVAEWRIMKKFPTADFYVLKVWTRRRTRRTGVLVPKGTHVCQLPEHMKWELP